MNCSLSARRIVGIARSALIATDTARREFAKHIAHAKQCAGIYLRFDRKLGDEKFWAFIHDDARLNSDFYDLSNIRHGWGNRPAVLTSNVIFSQRAHHLSDEESFDVRMRRF